jgi:hypothetical protein
LLTADDFDSLSLCLSRSVSLSVPLSLSILSLCLSLRPPCTEPTVAADSWTTGVPSALSLPEVYQSLLGQHVKCRDLHDKSCKGHDVTVVAMLDIHRQHRTLVRTRAGLPHTRCR